MKDFDIIFAGGGLSGTMLLYSLLQSSYKDHRFLLIDKTLQHHPYSQWSFWTTHNTPLDSILTKSWRSFDVSIDSVNQDFSLQTYTLSLLESLHYYSFIKEELNRFPNVTYIEDTVLTLTSNGDRAVVQTEHEQYEASFVFDSTTSAIPHNGISIQGLGALVTTKDNVFDADKVTFMDFRDIPENELCFFYVLPISQKQAYIDIAHVSSENASVLNSKHKKWLRSYLRNTLNIQTYTIEKEQFHSIPLWNNHLKRRVEKRVLKIGAAGGLIKSTTSYGFINILKDTEMIVESLTQHGDLRKIYTPSRITGLLDSAMLELMQKNPRAVRKMYAELFEESVKGDTILAYLNDELSYFETLKLLTRVNPKPMAEIFQQRVKKVLRTNKLI